MPAALTVQVPFPLVASHQVILTTSPQSSPQANLGELLLSTFRTIRKRATSQVRHLLPQVRNHHLCHFRREIWLLTWRRRLRRRCWQNGTAPLVTATISRPSTNNNNIMTWRYRLGTSLHHLECVAHVTYQLCRIQILEAHT